MGMELSPFGTSSGFSDDQDGRELDAYLAADFEGEPSRRGGSSATDFARPAYFQRLLRKSQYWTNTSRTPFGHPVAIG